MMYYYPESTLDTDRWVVVQRAERSPRGTKVVAVFQARDAEHAVSAASQLNAVHPQPVVDRFSKSTLYRWTPMRIQGY